jgi:NAD kinase
MRKIDYLKAKNKKTSAGKTSAKKNKKNILSECLSDIIVVHKTKSCNACSKVCSILKQLGFRYQAKHRDCITTGDFKKLRLAIVIAGDGTVLKTCRMINNNSIVFAVNSHPRLSEGALTRATLADFKKKFIQLACGKAIITKLPKIEALIGKARLPVMGINELSLSPEKPYHTMVYSIGKKIEKSSGILVSTPIGSTAWLKSAGGQEMLQSSKKLQYVVRDPYSGRIYNVKNKSGIVRSLKISALTPGIAVFDSLPPEKKFRRGDIITIRRAKSTVNFAEFKGIKDGR